MKQTALDLICTGRAGVDLYGEQVGGRLEDMGSFAKYVGGNPAMRLCLARGWLWGEDWQTSCSYANARTVPTQ